MNTFLKFALAALLLTVVGCNKNTNGETSDAKDAEMAHQEPSGDSVPEEAPDAGDVEKEQADDHVADAALIGEDWPLTHLNGESFGLEEGPTISFDEEGRIAGSTGCNRYMGDYKVTGEGEIEITMGGTTMMMCDDDAMDVERQIQELLPTVTKYEIDEDSGALTLHTSEGHKLSAE